MKGFQSWECCSLGHNPWERTGSRAKEEKPFRGLNGQHWVATSLKAFVCKAQVLKGSLADYPV